MADVISVVIPTYNRPDLLIHRSIPSVLAQTYQDWELVVVGDGAGPETVEAMATIEDPRVRFINISRSVYPADPEAAWQVVGVRPFNTGVNLARGQWITGLGDDDELMPRHMEVLLDLAQGHNVDGAYGRFEVVGHGFQGSYPPRHGRITNLLWRAGHYRMDPESWRRNLPADWDLWSRMLQDGASFAYTPEVVYRYHPSGRHIPRTVPA